ncbi:hypothetical protein DFR37_105129 [Eoetvoesiella caeni]|uniref:Uncharacterized protein n=1 Tax=Eoetvoesiella caeni TaxID=645616 RepID=A0A366HDI9_9BURK|nr:hypothetical protein DFR37_105129 [Eoetvoesiella caeni]
MTDIIEFLTIVNWPGALVVSAAIWFASRTIIKCYGRRN